MFRRGANSSPRPARAHRRAAPGAAAMLAIVAVCPRAAAGVSRCPHARGARAHHPNQCARQSEWEAREASARASPPVPSLRGKE
eukprot:scaffold30568_cov36-Tisochrysis_lutea.AAC.3